MKGNDGKAARRRSNQQVLVVCGSLLSLLVVLTLTGVIAPSLSIFSSTADDDRHFGSMRLRNSVMGGMTEGLRQAAAQTSHQVKASMQRQWAHKDEATLMKEVLAAELELVDLTVVESQLAKSPPNSYDGVYGEFCRLDWSKRKRDPSAVPMFRDLVNGSEGCTEHRFTLNLRKVADLARHQDEARKGDRDAMPRVLNLTAVTFHESRCGSTLVANSVAAMDSVKHRSYSEAQPPAVAMNSVCGRKYGKCSKKQASIIFRDVIYLMSRSKDPLEERVFFKFQSATTKSLDLFQMAFPDTPWMFVYRDPVQVMMSHIKDDPTLSGKANCLRSKRAPTPEILNVLRSHGVQDPRHMPPEDFCAAHLAAITESAVSNLSPTGIPVNYAALPDVLYTEILPKIFGRPLSAVEVDNIQQISQTYSKGRGSKHRTFTGDSAQKEQSATPAVQQAAQNFLTESYNQLEAFAAPILQRTL